MPTSVSETAPRSQSQFVRWEGRPRHTRGFTEYLSHFRVSNVQISNLRADIATEVQPTCSAFDGLALRPGPKSGNRQTVNINT